MERVKLIFWQIMSRLPARIRGLFLFARAGLRKVLIIPALKLKYRGTRYYCPTCQSEISTFKDFGFGKDSPTPNILCPVCGSLPRHRLDYLFFQRQTNLFDGSPKRMLHVAPEEIFKLRFTAIGNLDYVTADLYGTFVTVQMDVTDIPFPDDSFNVIYCSHVLEHVPNDRQALSELHRVLKPGGWAVLQVPINAEKTFEDPSATSAFDRELLFGQHDHVRRCGLDYEVRIQEAGFRTRVFRAIDIIDREDDFNKMGIQKGRVVFFCEK